MTVRKPALSPEVYMTQSATSPPQPGLEVDAGHGPHGPEHDAGAGAQDRARTLTAKKLAALAAFDLAAILVVGALVALAVWQVDRRAWKLDLIARVDARVHAAPSPAPGRDEWADISAALHEYRRVMVTGNWLTDRSTLVQAVTELGGGYWAIMPFARDDGTVVFVNRGFVPANERNSASWTPHLSSPVRAPDSCDCPSRAAACCVLTIPERTVGIRATSGRSPPPSG